MFRFPMFWRYVMRISWNDAGTQSNDGLRMLCTCLMIAGQGTLLSGCNQGKVASSQGGMVKGNITGDNSDNGNANANGDDNIGDIANDNSTDSSSDSAGAQSIDGYWISARTGNGAAMRGLATGGQLGDTVNITISEVDGSGWNFDGRFDGAVLTGTCGPSFQGGDLDIGGLFGEPPACRGEFSDDGDSLTLSADDGSEVRMWVLRRPAAPSPELTGSWVDDVAATRLICAYDGQMLSVLDPTNTILRFDAAWSESGGFVGIDSDGNRWTGLPDGEGSELFVLIEGADSMVAQHTFTREDEPAVMTTPLTGRWMSSYNNGELTNALRGQAAIIFDGTNLYVHQRDDNHRVLFEGDYAAGTYWSVFATFDGQRFESTSDSTTRWSGFVDPTGATLHGNWNGDERMSFGFTKAGSADPADLAGTWMSVSSDYETPSDPTQAIGEAQVRFDGSTLRIEDAYDDADYVIEAQWMGDHFEGQRWSLNDPGNRLRWSGEIVLDGALLHGKWEYGEWSLSPYQLRTRESLAEVGSDTMAVVADPFDDILAAYRNDDEEIAVTVYRKQGVVNRYSIVTGEGNVEIAVDERSRPVSVVAPDVSLTMVWTEDSSSVDLTINETSTVTAETITLDLSDAALTAALVEMKDVRGVDVDGLRAWIDEYPGRLEAVAAGDTILTSAEAASSKRARGTSINTFVKVNDRLARDGAAIAGLLLVAVVAGTKYIAALQSILVSGAFAAALGSLALLATAAAGIIIGILISDFISSCFPCSLDCFWNCFEQRQYIR